MVLLLLLVAAVVLLVLLLLLAATAGHAELSHLQQPEKKSIKQENRRPPR